MHRTFLDFAALKMRNDRSKGISMSKLIIQLLTFIALILLAFGVHAADGYRFLHVTIETPWAIFIFLLLFIMTPFVLMAVLYWYFAYKNNKEERMQNAQEQESTIE